MVRVGACTMCVCVLYEFMYGVCLCVSECCMCAYVYDMICVCVCLIGKTCVRIVQCVGMLLYVVDGVKTGCGCVECVCIIVHVCVGYVGVVYVCCVCVV